MNYFFPGMIDEFSLYARDLTASEILGIYIAGSAGKCGQAPTSSVVVRNISGKANIFGAGHLELPTSVPGEGGLPPAEYKFAAGVAKVLKFFKVEGGVSLNGAGGLPFYGPDGGPLPGYTDVTPVLGISGIKHTNSSFLAGVFLTDSEPRDPAPSTLDFNHPSALTFRTLKPAIGQLFYIGDGRNPNGIPQGFMAPTNATGLFLGIVDGWNNSCICGPTRAYSDNAGGFQATFTVADEGLSCAPVPPGLISLWREGAYDSAMGNTGRLEGGVQRIFPLVGTDDLVDSALRFDGMDDAVVITNTTFLNPTNLTVQAWVRLTGLDSASASQPGLQYIIFKQNTRDVNFEGYALLKLRDGGVDRFAFAMSSASGAASGALSGPIVAGRWYHVAGTFDGKTTRLFVDGLEVAAHAAPANFAMNLSSKPLYFGRSGFDGFDGRFFGDLDEPALFNRALSAAEIAQIYLADAVGLCPPFAHVEPAIRGQVVDSQNRPVPRAQVAAFTDEKQFMALGFNGALKNGFTDGNGVFRLEGFKPDQSVILIARFDANLNGLDDDGRYFLPFAKVAFAGNYDDLVNLTLSDGTDFTRPTVEIASPSPQTSADFTNSPVISGVFTDTGGSGLNDGWGVLVRNTDGQQMFFNWDTRLFEKALVDKAELYRHTIGINNGTAKAFDFELPKLGAGAYQIRLLAVDNARNSQRRDYNFNIVPVVRIFPQTGTYDLPPLPPETLLKVEATEAAKVTLKVSKDTTMAEVRVGAELGAEIALIIDPTKTLVSGLGVTLGQSATLAAAGRVVAPVENILGNLMRSVNAAGLPSMLAGGLGKASVLANLIPTKILSKVGKATMQSFDAVHAFGSVHAASVVTDLGLTGPIQIEGNYVQQSGGRLAIAIAGGSYVESGIKEYDRLEVSGIATLEGTIAIGFYNPNDPTNPTQLYVPPLGAAFDVVVASNIVAGDLTLLSPVWSNGNSFASEIIGRADGREALRLTVIQTTPSLGIAKGSDGSVEVFFQPLFEGYRLEASTTLNSWSEVGRNTNLFNAPTSGARRIFRAVQN